MNQPYYNRDSREIEDSQHEEFNRERTELESAFEMIHNEVQNLTSGTVGIELFQSGSSKITDAIEIDFLTPFTVNKLTQDRAEIDLESVDDQEMSGELRIKRSDVNGEVPDLVYGQFAWNDTDEILYIGDTGDNTKQIALGNNAKTLSTILSNGNDAQQDDILNLNDLEVDQIKGASNTAVNNGKISNLTTGNIYPINSTIDFNNNRLTGVNDPQFDQDVVNKRSLDAVQQGIDSKESVRLATNGNDIDLNNGTFGGSIDSTSVNDGDRVLIKDQDNSVYNGLYTYDASGNTTGTAQTFYRSDDMDEDSEVDGGEFVFIRDGTNNANRGYQVISNSPTLNSDPIKWTQISGAGSFTAGAGLTKNGNTIDVNVGDGITVGSQVEADVDNNTISFDGTGQIKLAGGSAGSGLKQDGSNGLYVNTDGSTLDISSDQVIVKDQGIGRDQIDTSLAGDGLQGGGGSPLAVKTNNSLSVITDNLGINLDSNSINTSGASSVNPLDVTSNGLNLGIDNEEIVLDSNNALTTGDISALTFQDGIRGLPDNEELKIQRFELPNDRELLVHKARVGTKLNNNVSNLTIELYDYSNNTLVYSTDQSVLQEGTPLASVSAGSDVEVRIKNDSGSSLDVQGLMQVKLRSV